MQNITHAVVGPTDLLIAVAHSRSEAEGYADQARALGTAADIVDMTATDVSTIARLAARNSPNLTAVGSGPLGAGTHPAQPYLEVMLGMVGVGTEYNVRDIRFGYDDAESIIRYFLGNASQWRGDLARAGKARLNAIVAAR